MVEWMNGWVDDPFLGRLVVAWPGLALPRPLSSTSPHYTFLSPSLQVDRVEFLYTRFINLITSEPSIRTVLPLKAQGIEDQEVRADVHT